MNKAIETTYGGVTYRSKNEASWAFFMSFAGWTTDYEPQWFHGWNDLSYKPDFYIRDFDIYAEVKSTVQGIWDCADKLNGAIDWEATPVSRGLLLLGSFPYDVRVHSFRMKTKYLFWHKGVCCADAYIEMDSAPFGPWFTIRLTNDHFDIGDPLPPSASPDIYIEQQPGHEYLARAVKETNDYFKK